MEKIRLKVYRGDSVKGELKEYQLEIDEGMVVLDAIHKIQATQAPDLACRWNCKAGRCGSCSAEVNGFPRFAKGVHASLTREFPVRVVLTERLGLLGAARAAFAA